MHIGKGFEHRRKVHHFAQLLVLFAWDSDGHPLLIGRRSRKKRRVLWMLSAGKDWVGVSDLCSLWECCMPRKLMCANTISALLAASATGRATSGSG